MPALKQTHLPKHKTSFHKPSTPSKHFPKAVLKKRNQNYYAHTLFGLPPCFCAGAFVGALLTVNRVRSVFVSRFASYLLSILAVWVMGLVNAY